MVWYTMLSWYTLVIQVAAWVTMPSPERVNGEHLGENMPDFSLAQVMAETKKARTDFYNEQQRLREDFEKKSSEATERYEKSLVRSGDRVSVIAQKVQAVVCNSEEGYTMTKGLLADSLAGIRDVLYWTSRELQNGRDPRTDITRLESVQEFTSVWLKGIEHEVSQSHPDQQPLHVQEYLAKLLTDLLLQKQISVTVTIQLRETSKPIIIHFSDGTQRECVNIEMETTVTFL